MITQSLVISVIGPLRVSGGIAAEVTSRTVELMALIRSIVDRLCEALGITYSVSIECQDESLVSDIVPSVLRKITRADLVVCDITSGDSSVSYELGLVHALGIPYVIVSCGDAPPPYLKKSECITDMKIDHLYDSQERSHQVLADHMRLFLMRQLENDENAPEIESFYPNPVTSYFQGLPIIDISPAAGLAAGYWTNFISLFSKKNGYLSNACRIEYDKIPGSPIDKISETLKIGQLIILQPTDISMVNHAQDYRALTETLEKLDLCSIDATVASLGAIKPRKLWIKLLASKSSGAPMSPGILVDIPAILFALQHSPLLTDVGSYEVKYNDRAEIEYLHTIRIRKLMDRFGRVLRYHIRRSDDKEHWHKIHYVSPLELPFLLERLLSSAT